MRSLAFCSDNHGSRDGRNESPGHPLTSVGTLVLGLRSPDLISPSRSPNSPAFLRASAESDATSAPCTAERPARAIKHLDDQELDDLPGH